MENDLCFLGSCVGGDLVECVVFECASFVSCDSGVGCVVQWKLSGVECDDGNACFLVDSCDLDHSCVGEFKNCSDYNLCTVDLCDLELGCSNEVSAIIDGVLCSFEKVCGGLG